VGDSPDHFFVGPEAPGVVPEVVSYKDAQGRIKRQAARFRVYAFLEDGTVEELTTDTPAVASITWTVELANRKADWFEFAGAGRIAEILAGTATYPRRNKSVPLANREGLIIGPVSGSVSGANQVGPRLEGRFSVPGRDPVSVYLGQLNTDKAGRLQVLGGRGRSGSVELDNPLFSYANNDAWYDDTSDGPIKAQVTLRDGTTVEVRGSAWVIVAPPHYSPHTQNAVTAYDVMTEAALRHGLDWDARELGPKPDGQTSFTRDIYPILERLGLYQWVSDRVHRGHAKGKRGSFLDPEMLRVLADPVLAADAQSPHKRIFGRLRIPIVHPPSTDAKPFDVAIDPGSLEARNQSTLYYMPALSGDEGDVEHQDPKTWLSLTEVQYAHFSRWQNGEFSGDWGGSPPALPPLDELPADRQPAALTRAALEACQGGAFFPGIEISSIARHRETYDSGAFRINDSLKAGDLTKWMALPWQADFYECNSHWWPAVRPDAVVPEHDFDRLLGEFALEAERGNLSALLVARQPWARGVGEVAPSRPTLPSPEPGHPALALQAATERKLRAWAAPLLDPRRDFLPQPMPNELGDVYEQRLVEFLVRSLQLAPSVLPQRLPKEMAGAFRTRVIAALAERFHKELQVSPPTDGESPEKYGQRISEEASKRPVWQGLIDLDWRRRYAHRGKNEFVTVWNQMGFLKRRAVHGEIILVEGDRKPYQLLSFRNYFHYLMNIEAYPDFLPRAKELARQYFDLARAEEPSLVALPELRQYRFFKYDPITFQARMEEIYEVEKRNAEAYNPVTGGGESLFRTPAHVRERIRQLAPFNQLDGSWLERIAKAGPISDIQSFLFEIWSDEIGNGDPAQNHANVYTDLMRNAGIYLPPINSEAYAHHPDLWAASFQSPVYQSSAALFPETFYPELLGMTLYLEWEAVYLPAMVKLYEYYGYPSLFYKLHVAIDNPVNGHGARAKDAVVRYLNDIRTQGGDAEMQEHWRRVWDGYMAFKFIGSEEWSYRFANPATLDERMVEMIVQKRRYGQLNHGVKRFAGNLLNDWFDEPADFLRALADSDLVAKGEAKKSPIFELMGQTGPMLKVFTPRDKELWAQWIDSLPRERVGTPDAGSDMLTLLRQLAARGSSAGGHEEFVLKGLYDDPVAGRQVVVDRPVSWWFTIDQPEKFMAALADESNGWIVRGSADQSRLVRELLSPARPMARLLASSIPELGDKPARLIIVDWINADCPLPPSPPKAHLAARLDLMSGRVPGTERYGSDEYAAEVVRSTLTSTSTSPELIRALATHRYGPGGGACH
jgi:hypothetical protein